MNKKRTAAVYRVALSAIVVSVYFAVMLLTAEFSFGIYQIRIATAFYALALPFPFLVLPLAVANCLSNILGGMAWDIAGGFLAGLFTAGLCALAGKVRIGRWKTLLVVPAIEFVPALSVPLWLAPTLGVPYWTLAVSLLVGQLVPAFVGAAIVLLLEKRAKLLNLHVFGMKLSANPDSAACEETVVSDSAAHKPTVVSDSGGDQTGESLVSDCSDPENDRARKESVPSGAESANASKKKKENETEDIK